nr:flagellin [Anaerolineaceae bacterium]
AHRDLVIKLQDAGGSDLTNAITVTNYAGAAVQTVDFSTQYVGQTTSRGIDRVDLATSLATAAVGTYSAVIGYTRKDDYNIKTNGAGTEGTLTTAGANGRSDATNKYLATAQQYNDFMSYLETKANEVNQQMAMIGSFVGRLSFKEDQVTNAQINVEGSWNRIMNANMAEEQVNASKLLILQQTATAMLAQANAAPQFLLSLFK